MVQVGRSDAVTRAVREAGVRTDLGSRCGADGLVQSRCTSDRRALKRCRPSAHLRRPWRDTYPGVRRIHAAERSSSICRRVIVRRGCSVAHPDLRFGRSPTASIPTLLTPLMWRLEDSFWVSMVRDQTPWVDRFPSEYLIDHVRFCACRVRWTDRPSADRRAAMDLRQEPRGPADGTASSLTPHWIDVPAENDVVAGMARHEQRRDGCCGATPPTSTVRRFP